MSVSLWMTRPELPKLTTTLLHAVRSKKNLKWSGWLNTGFLASAAAEFWGRKKAGNARSSRSMMSITTGVALLRKLESKLERENSLLPNSHSFSGKHGAPPLGTCG